MDTHETLETRVSIDFASRYHQINRTLVADNIPFLSVMLDTCFGEVWTREGLSIRDRRLIIIGLLAALGETAPYVIQMQAALAKGEMTADQIREILVLLSQYIGIPRTSRLFQAVHAAGLPV